MQFSRVTAADVRARSVLCVEDSIGSRSRATKGQDGLLDPRLQDQWGHIELAAPVPKWLFISEYLFAAGSRCCICDAAGKSNCTTHGAQTWILYDNFYPRPVCTQRNPITPWAVWSALRRSRDESLMWTAFPIPPIRMRPKKDDLTLLLRAIVRANNALLEDSGVPTIELYLSNGCLYESEWEAQWQRKRRRSETNDLYWRLVRAVFAYTNSQAHPASEKQYGTPRASLTCRFTLPTRKKARVRGSLVTKCTKLLVRAVAARSYSTEIDVVELPRWVAERIGVRDGDIGVLNRQPTLWENGMLGVRVRTIDRPSNVIGVHLALCKGFNLDFDGDEIVFYAVTGEEARTDVAGKMMVEHHLTHDDTPVVTFLGDAIVAAYRLSSPQAFVTRAELCQLLAAFPFLDPPEEGCSVFFGKQAISMMLPKGLRMRYKDVVVEDGVMIEGRWTNATLNDRGGLISAVIAHIGARAATEWMGYAYEFLLRYTAEQAGASFNLEDLQQVSRVGVSTEAGVVSLEGLPDSFEYLRCGSKGKVENLLQLCLHVGQQFSYLNEKFGLTCHGSEVRGAYGNVESSFLSGLSPVEHYLHLAASRSKLVDTAVVTADTGTLQVRKTMWCTS